MLMVVNSSIAVFASAIVNGFSEVDVLEILTVTSLVIGVMALPPSSPLTVKRTTQLENLVTWLATEIVTVAVLAFAKDTQSSPDKRAQVNVGLSMFVVEAVTVSEEPPIVRLTRFLFMDAVGVKFFQIGHLQLRINTR